MLLPSFRLAHELVQSLLAPALFPGSHEHSVLMLFSSLCFGLCFGL